MAGATAPIAKVVPMPRRDADLEETSRLGPTDDGESQPDADPESVARTICLRLLTVRSRTRAELADALRSRNVPDTAALAVLERFTEVGLIDDASFARMYAATRHRERGLAAREIARQLRDKGVDDDTVRDALDEIDPSTEFETARRLAQRKLKGMSGLDDATRTRRLAGMLARKGYSPGVTFAAVRSVLGESAAEAMSDLDGSG